MKERKFCQSCGIDYHPKAEVSIQFFKRVQNKIHYAVSGETAAEVIYHRADAEKDFMGLMSFSGEQPTLRETKIERIIWMKKNFEQWVSWYLDILILRKDKRNGKSQ